MTDQSIIMFNPVRQSHEGTYYCSVEGYPQPTATGRLYVRARRGCSPGLFACANGNCVSQAARCNGVNECGDSSDEAGCPSSKFYGYTQLSNRLRGVVALCYQHQWC